MTDDNPFSTPQQASSGGAAAGFDHADRGTRFLGLLLDGFIAFAAAMVGVFVGAALAMALGMPFEAYGEEMPPGVAVTIAVASLFTLPVTFVNWYFITVQGQSIAKIFLKMRIVKVDGSPCGFVNGVILRSWVYGLLQAVVQVMTCGLLGWVVPLVDGGLIFRDDFRTLHDHIAQTVVIKA